MILEEVTVDVTVDVDQEGVDVIEEEVDAVEEDIIEMIVDVVMTTLYS